MLQSQQDFLRNEIKGLSGENLIFRQLVVTLALRTWEMLEFLRMVKYLDEIYQSPPGTRMGRVLPREHQETLIRIFQETRNLIPVGNP